MEKSRFAEAQIIGVLREQEAGSPTAEACRETGTHASMEKRQIEYRC
jgi:hypothetical protein